MSRQKICGCGEPAMRGYSMCPTCIEAAESHEHEEFESRIEVIELNNVDNLDELKAWIKENMIRR
jgi:hypothetical protein